MATTPRRPAFPTHLPSGRPAVPRAFSSRQGAVGIGGLPAALRGGGAADPSAPPRPDHRLPPPRTLDPSRRARDGALRGIDEQIADHLEAARQSGELASADSWGQPMAEMEGWAETPPEFRLPFKILKNAKVAPPELDLFHQRAALRQQVADAPEGPQRRQLQQRLAELEQALALRLEHLRTTGSL